MRGQALLSELFDRKVIKVLMFLVANMNKDLYLNEISHGSNVPLATSFRILGKMDAQVADKRIVFLFYLFFFYN